MPSTDPIIKTSMDTEQGILQQLKAWDIAAFLGLLTFSTTLAHEYGRASYWGFPAELVRFSSENALLTFIRLAIASIVVYMITLICRVWKLYRILVSLLSIIIIALGSWTLANQWGGLAYMTAVVGIGYTIWALDLYSKNDTPKDEGSRMLLLHLGKGGIALSVALILVPCASFLLGLYHAMEQKAFIVTKTEPKHVILATYGSEAVCATLNINQVNGKRIKSFHLISLSSDHAKDLVTESIGSVMLGTGMTPSTLDGEKASNKK